MTLIACGGTADEGSESTTTSTVPLEDVVEETLDITSAGGGVRDCVREEFSARIEAEEVISDRAAVEDSIERVVDSCLDQVAADLDEIAGGVTQDDPGTDSGGSDGVEVGDGMWHLDYVAPNGFEYRFTADLRDIRSRPANPGYSYISLPSFTVTNLHEDREAPLGNASTPKGVRFALVILLRDSGTRCLEVSGNNMTIDGYGVCPVYIEFTDTLVDLPPGGSVQPEQFESDAYDDVVVDWLGEMDGDVRVALLADAVYHGGLNLERPAEEAVDAVNLCFTELSSDRAYPPSGDWLIGYTDPTGEPVDPSADGLVWPEIGCDQDRIVADPGDIYSFTIHDDEDGATLLSTFETAANVRVGQTVNVVFRASHPCRLVLTGDWTLDGAPVTEVVLDTRDQEVDLIPVAAGEASLECEGLEPNPLALDLEGPFYLDVLE
jgi:hypothetical protein